MPNFMCVVPVSLQDIHLRKPFKSSMPHDQQVVSQITMPSAIQNSYNHCDQPPALSKLDVFR